MRGIRALLEIRDEFRRRVQARIDLHIAMQLERRNGRSRVGALRLVLLDRVERLLGPARGTRDRPAHRRGSVGNRRPPVGVGHAGAVSSFFDISAHRDIIAGTDSQLICGFSADDMP